MGHLFHLHQQQKSTVNEKQWIRIEAAAG
jgi:hypothetical protein